MSEKTGRNVALWWCVGIAVVVIAIYSNALQVPFLMDDESSIKDNPTMKSFSSAFMPPGNSGVTVSGRPVVNLTLTVNYAIGGLRVTGYHCTSIMLHIFAAWTLFGLTRHALRLPTVQSFAGDDVEWTAGVVAMLWAFHPIQTESVTYIIQRAEILVSLFYLLTFYCFVRSLNSPVLTRWKVASVLSCVLGMASKEVMVTAPLAVFTFDAVFVSGSAWKSWMLRRKYYLALASTLLVLFGCIASSGLRGGTVGLAPTITIWSYFLTQCHAVIHYLSLAVWPQTLVFDYGRSVVGGFYQVWPQCVVLGVAVLLLAYAWRRNRPIAWLGSMYFLILAPTSSVVPVITQTMAEHRVYLALAPVLLLLVLALRKFLKYRAVFLWVPVGLVFCCLTVLRNQDYRSADTIWQDTVKKVPNNARAWSTISILSSDRGDFEGARIAIERAVFLEPDDVGIAANHASLLLKLGENKDAEELYRWILIRAPKLYIACFNFGAFLLDQGRAEEAVTVLLQAIATKPLAADAHYNLGNAYVLLNRSPDAIKSYQSAIKSDPDMLDAYNNLAAALVKEGRPLEALEIIERASVRFPQSNALRRTRALALVGAGRAAEAISELKTMQAMDPKNSGLYADLGLAFIESKNHLDAIHCYYEALRLGYGAGSPKVERALRVSLAELLLASEVPAAAADEYSKAALLDPANVELQFLSAHALLVAGKPESAAIEFERLLSRNPPTAEIYNDLGVAYLRLARNVEARAQFEAALRLRPGFEQALENLRALTP